MIERYPGRRSRTQAARGARFLLALTAALLITGCGDDFDVTKPAVALVVGDSLLYQSAPEVKAALEDKGWVPAMDARPGSGISGGFSIGGWPERVAELVRATKPDVAIVELGTNGCQGCESLDRAIDAVMRPLRDVPRVYWLNVKEYSPIPPDPKAVNDALERAHERWDNLRIVDMNDEFADKRDLLSDGVHFTREGERLFAELVEDQLPDVS
jgi:lysophospholipase L1-like esterase